MKNTQIYLLTLVILGFGLSSCSKYNNKIKGTGPIVTESFEMADISGVALSIDANVIVTKGDSQIVAITGQQNIISNIEKYVTPDGIWRIGYYNSVKNHAGVTIYITTNSFDYAAVSGSGNVQGTNHFPDSSHVYLNISGSGNITLSTDAQLVESVISGSGQISLDGSTIEHSINISGSGGIRAFGLETDNTYVRVSGSGNCEVTAEELLDINISGSGNVYYKGEPQMVVDISGSGAIINRN